MKQIICFFGTPQSTTGWFANPFGSRTSFQETPEAQAEVTMPVAGTIRNLRVRMTVAPGSGGSRTFTFRKNGANASVTVTISNTDTEATDTSNSFTVAAGDRVAMALNKSGTTAATDCICSFEFEHDDANTSIYGFGGQNTQNTELRYSGLLYAPNFGGIGWPSTTAGTIFSSLVAIPGTVTGYRIRASTTPGASKSWTFAIYKNSVKQDGTGGTVNTTAVMNDAAFPSITASFSLSVVAGDLLEIEASPSGTPTASRLNGIAVFSATNAGLANFGSSHNAVPTASASRFFWPYGGWTLTGATTESDREQVSNPTTLTLNSIRARATRASGSLSSALTFTLRKNGSDTGLSVTVSGASPATGTSDGEITIADGEDFTLEVTAAGAVAGDTAFQVVFSQGVIPLSERNLLTGREHTVDGDDNFICGASGTVTGNRVALFALSLSSPAPSYTGDAAMVVYGDVLMLTLPTSDPSVAGQLWNDAGTLKVSAG